MITTTLGSFSGSRVARKQRETARVYVHLAIQKILPYTPIVCVSVCARMRKGYFWEMSFPRLHVY